MVLAALYLALKNIVTGSRIHRKSHQKFDDCYHILETISENSDTEVRVLKVRRFSDGQIFCAKMVYKSATKVKRGAANEQNEIMYLKQLQDSSSSNRNVVMLEEYFDEIDRIVIVIEYLETNLYEILKNYKRLSEGNVRSVARAIFALLASLESRDLVHGDVVLQNFMLKREGDAFEALKIVDFNTCDTQTNRATCSRIQSKAQFLSSQHSAIAPETISSYEISCKSDVWGAGVIIYTLIFGTVPFNGRNADEIYENILTKEPMFACPDDDEEEIQQGLSEAGKKLFTISHLCGDFLKAVLNKSPDLRISAQQALQHPWLKPPIYQ